MDVIEKLTRMVSEREEPRMWEYRQMEQLLTCLGFAAIVVVVIVVGWLIL